MKNFRTIIVLALTALFLVCSVVVNSVRLLEHHQSQQRKTVPPTPPADFQTMRVKLIEKIESEDRAKQTPNQPFWPTPEQDQ